VSARLLLVPLAALTLMAGVLPLGAAAYGGWIGLQAGLADPALAHALRSAALGAAVAAPVAVALGLAASLAIWRASAWVRLAVGALAVMVMLMPAPGFESLDFLVPPRPGMAMAFACCVARGAALASLVLGAGLRRVPEGLQRTAVLAGASPVQAWRHAVLAPLRPYLLFALAAAGVAALVEGPAGEVLAPHLDLAEAWVAPAALLLVASSVVALAVLTRRRRT
jgi:ABC-type spermidine/putrescine transport system permease subunit II